MSGWMERRGLIATIINSTKIILLFERRCLFWDLTVWNDRKQLSKLNCGKTLIHEPTLFICQILRNNVIYLHIFITQFINKNCYGIEGIVAVTCSHFWFILNGSNNIRGLKFRNRAGPKLVKFLLWLHKEEINYNQTK